MNFSIKQIHHFIILSEVLHLTEASKKLFMTPSALHKQIRNLEDELEDKLFKTKGKKIQLTEFGESLLPQARKMIKEYHELIKQAQYSKNSIKPIQVNIGFTHQKPMFELIKRFKEKHPNILINVKVSLWEEQQIQLLNDKNSLFISGEPASMNAECHYEVLRKSELVFVVGNSHPLFNQEELVKGDIQEITFAVTSNFSPFDQNMLGYSQKKLLQWVSALTMKKSLLKLSSFDSIQSATEAGLCVGCLPESIVDSSLREGKLKKIFLKDFPKIDWELFLIYHKELNINDSTSTFLTFLKNSFFETY